MQVTLVQVKAAATTAVLVACFEVELDDSAGSGVVAGAAVG